MVAVSSVTAASTDETRFSLGLTPLGHVCVEPASPEDMPLDMSLGRRIRREFELGSGPGLLHLGACEPTVVLPPVFSFWRDFARRFVTAVCGQAELEEKRESINVASPLEDFEALVLSAPPMTGGEYLRAPVLESLWQALLDAFRGEVRGFQGPVQALLAAKNPAWNVVGRVHFHLAENKRDPERPFAFLATYTTGLSAKGAPQHRPLGEAVRQSSSEKDKDRLLALLLPVRKAGQKSAYIKELSDGGQLFQPLAWTPQEAHRFLQEVSAIEESGVRVRVPDWWKVRAPPRPQVTVSVGKASPSQLGVDAMLDFSVKLTLGGEELTDAELRALRSGSDGLVLLKGKWVEVDREKLSAVLDHWQKVAQKAEGGLSFVEGMRLLAGVPVAGDAASELQREWLGVQAGPWLQHTLADIRSGAEVEPGPDFKATLRPYQRQGLHWLFFLSRLRLGACLADDMGLGKTIQVLALLLLIKEQKVLPGPHLLVVPASLIANWKGEAQRFTPGLKVSIAHSSGGVSRDELALADVVITSYGMVQRAPWMTEQPWGIVVLDEAQAIKNAGAKQTKAVKALQTQSRIALTGTPVENRVGDLWSIFDFLNPGLLGTTKEFSAFVKRTDTYAPLRELTRPYILRRMKTDKSIITDLPEKTELKAFCSLTKRQVALYQESVEALSAQLQNVDAMARRGVVLSYLMRLKQICNHPSQWLGDGAYAADESGKFERLRELCETIASRQEKVLVFTQFREMTEPIAAWLARIFGKPGLVLSGETAVKKRQEWVTRFQNDEQVPFFVLSLKAGGTGLTLTAASHVIHFDRWWNPAVENQATDRAFRIGQRKNVLVHKFVCRGTIEERVDALLESKRDLAGELLGGGNEMTLTELADDELMRLVSLDVRSARVEG